MIDIERSAFGNSQAQQTADTAPEEWQSLKPQSKNGIAPKVRAGFRVRWTTSTAPEAWASRRAQSMIDIWPMERAKSQNHRMQSKLDFHSVDLPLGSSRL